MAHCLAAESSCCKHTLPLCAATDFVRGHECSNNYCPLWCPSRWTWHWFCQPLIQKLTSSCCGWNVHAGASNGSLESALLTAEEYILSFCKFSGVALGVNGKLLQPERCHQRHWKWDIETETLKVLRTRRRKFWGGCGLRRWYPHLQPTRGYGGASLAT